GPWLVPHPVIRFQFLKSGPETRVNVLCQDLKRRIDMGIHVQNPVAVFHRCLLSPSVSSHCHAMVCVCQGTSAPESGLGRVGCGSLLEFIPIYGSRGLRGTEAPAIAGGQCTGLQSRSRSWRSRI